jgi:hypothetical protein
MNTSTCVPNNLPYRATGPLVASGPLVATAPESPFAVPSGSTVADAVMARSRPEQRPDPSVPVLVFKSASERDNNAAATSTKYSPANITRVDRRPSVLDDQLAARIPSGAAEKASVFVSPTTRPRRLSGTRSCITVNTITGCRAKFSRFTALPAVLGRLHSLGRPQAAAEPFWDSCQILGGDRSRLLSSHGSPTPTPTTVAGAGSRRIVPSDQIGYPPQTRPKQVTRWRRAGRACRSTAGFRSNRRDRR